MTQEAPARTKIPTTGARRSRTILRRAAEGGPHGPRQGPRDQHDGVGDERGDRADVRHHAHGSEGVGVEQPAQESEFGEGLPRRGLPGPTPHSQGTQEKSAEEHDNADDQQIQQALGDDTHDAEHDRDDHEE
jgi:hypothetical protein